MRIFKLYAPRQIAKYVMAFFKGDFKVEGRGGTFRFDGGKVVVDARQDSVMRRMGAEINSVIAAMSQRPMPI